MKKHILALAISAIATGTFAQAAAPAASTIDKVKASTLSEADAETEILAFLKKYVPKSAYPG